MGFGTAPIGNHFRAVAEDDAPRCFRRAWDAGVRYFDTAPMYGHGLRSTAWARRCASIRATSMCCRPRSGGC